MNNWQGLLDVQAGREPSDEDVFSSQTAVNNALLCGGRLLYKGQEGYNHTPTEAMSFGTMVHGGIEKLLRVGEQCPACNDDGVLHTMGGDIIGPCPECGEDSTPLTLGYADLEEMWADGLRNERDGSFDLYELATTERIERSVVEASDAINQWAIDVLPALGLGVDEELYVEERVTAQLGTLPDGRAVWFGGTADLVRPERDLIIDWKTAGRGWNDTKAPFTLQATYYSWLYGQANHAYWVWSRRAKDWTLFETSRTQDQIDAALKVAWQIARQQADGTLTANPLEDNYQKIKRGWHCSAKFCGAWDICEFKFVNDNVWEGQRIDPKIGWE